MMMEDFEDLVEVTPTVMTLEALLEGGLESLPHGVRHALEREDFSEALKEANKTYSKKGARDKEAALTYAILLVGRELCDEALGVLRRALIHHAQDVGLQLAQAEALVVKGDFEAALALLEALEQVTVTKPRHLSFIGDMYLDMGADERAIECYQEGIEGGAVQLDVVYRLAQLLAERDDLEGAAYYFGMAARLGVNNAMLWQSAAEAYYEAEQVEEAVYAFGRQLDQQPYDERAWLLLGLSHIYLDQYEEAAEAFEEVVDLSPRHQVAWAQLGHVYLALGRQEDALKAFRQALALESEDLDALNGAMLASYELGDVEAARSWGSKALEVDPTDEESRYNLGVILLALRRPEEAREIVAPLIVAEGDEGAESPEQPKYMGAQAIAKMMLGQREAAMEQIQASQRLGVEAPWLAAFAEEVLKSEGAQAAIEFLDSMDNGEPTWSAVRPMLAYLCCGLLGDEALGRGYIKLFAQAVRDQPQVVPVMWNFDSWEAFAFRLDRPFEGVFDGMLAILEGRQELEDFESFLE